MSNKTFTTFLFLITFLCGFAQINTKIVSDSLKKVQLPPVDCQPAKDSLKRRLARGEFSFYNILKYQPNQYSFISINKNRYTRVIYPQGYPSPGFIFCYNKEIKKVMDSVYKVDFFKKTDSILASYDHSGRGYSNTDFPGGAGALQKFLDKNIALPKDSKPDDGSHFIRVYYSFIIDERGNISEIKLVKSNCKACEEAVLSAIKKMPDFIPATDAGVPKKVKYILPYSKT